MSRLLSRSLLEISRARLRSNLIVRWDGKVGPAGAANPEVTEDTPRPSGTSSGDKYYGNIETFFERQTINISIWSVNILVTRHLFLVVRSILKQAKEEAAKKGIKTLRISGNGSLYNYDFSTTLFGAEFNLDFSQIVQEYQVDVDQSAKPSIVEEFVQDGHPQNQDLAGPDGVGRT